VAVACSGGLDSLVLLHLFRFSLRPLGLEVDVAHFDHRMRPESGADAEWISELAKRWGIGLHLDRATTPPHDEASARALRYIFLEGLVRRGHVERVLTAHHSDDQVETVLFRIVRGTGLEGLAGIPEERKPGILRPFLFFTRAELEGYAEVHGLDPREDETNRSARFARNRVRHTVLPLLEEVHPGARAGILRLAANAAEASAALETLVEPILHRVRLSSALGGQGEQAETIFDRDRFLGEPEPVQRALLRSVVRSLGIPLSWAGTASALQFMREGTSGTEQGFQGGLRIGRDYGSIRITLGSPEDEEGNPRADGDLPSELIIPSATRGSGRLRVGGETFEVAWGEAERPETEPGEGAEFDSGCLRFPLTVRGWRDGDRTQTTGGGKKLKKLFGEWETPRRDRARIPILADVSGEVLWIPGFHRAPGFEPGSSTPPDARFCIRTRDAGRS
jgi:tRNA(Ile)-lysidine synthase